MFWLGRAGKLKLLTYGFDPLESFGKGPLSDLVFLLKDLNENAGMTERLVSPSPSLMRRLLVSKSLQ